MKRYLRSKWHLIRWRVRWLAEAFGRTAAKLRHRHEATLRLATWLSASLVASFGLLALADPFVHPPMRTCSWGMGWFGCVLANHESLAGACFTIVAALVAWAALQEQLRAGVADRRIARGLLIDELEWQAEAIGAAWSLLSDIDNISTAEKEQRREAVRYGCNWVSRPEMLRDHRQMTSLLSWEERTYFEKLLRGLEHIGAIKWDDDDWSSEAERAFIDVAWLFEHLKPETGQYFEGFWRPQPKAMTTGDFVRQIAGRY